MTKIHTAAPPKRKYEKPVLKQIGSLKNITLKLGSIADSMVVSRSI